MGVAGSQYGCSQDVHFTHITVMIENLNMINFKLRTCRFVDQTYEKAIVFLVFLDERYLLNYLEKLH